MKTILKIMITIGILSSCSYRPHNGCAFSIEANNDGKSIIAIQLM